MNEIKLNKQVRRLLRPALRGAATVFKEIEQGKALLVQTANKKLLAVLRGEGKELVVVAVAGSDLYNTRAEFINLARVRNYTTIRFHTTHPERLQKGLKGLDVQLVETRQRLLGRDELVYKYQVI